MKAFTTTIGLILALTTSISQAVPTLLFNGQINYTAGTTTLGTNTLSVTSELISTQDIFPAPNLNGSLNFDAALLSSYFGFGINVGSFGTIVGQDDITIKDAGGVNTLLTGNFTSLVMSGNDNDVSGSITGELVSTGGSLATEFGTGNVLALQFNLNTTFNSSMFDSDFSGLINGDIRGQATAVPEPSLIALLSVGILFIGYAGKKSRTPSSIH